MSNAVHSLANSRAVDIVPDEVREELFRFLLDKSTGNFVLNIKDGRILNAWANKQVHVEKT